MPIPTSLIVVLLVVAWLAVLVPMVARRREHVPEAEEGGARFRVLRRASASLRLRRPGRRPDEIEAEGTDLDDEENEDVGELDEELLDDDDIDSDDDAEFDDDEDEFERQAGFEQQDEFEQRAGFEAQAEAEQDAEEFEPEPVTAAVSPRGTRRDQADGRVPRREHVTIGGAQPAVAERVSAGQPREFDEAEPRTESLSRPSARPYHRGDAGDQGYDVQHAAVQNHAVQNHADDDRYRPVPQRRGRGGFDPEAAEATKAYRYKRRRRITLFLLLATVAFSAAAYLLSPLLWAGAGFFGLLLVAYLAYLRRQVRIEENIRQRRLAKLQRARQTRPEYHSAQAPAAPATRHGAPPSVYVPGRRVVEMDDDDPTFDDLEYYQPVAYRRASGQ